MANTSQPSRVMLAAGGTGGHIMPAVALAEALGRLAPEVEVQFCSGNRPAELQIYRRLGLRPWVMPMAHHRRGWAARTRLAFQLVTAFRRARRLLRKRPVQVAVGFGCYVAVAPMLAARSRGARLILHEQNIRPGLANRLLAPWARHIATASPEGARGFPDRKTCCVGNPVRAAFLEPVDRCRAREHFRLPETTPVCLCLGGSQGARGLNRLVLDLLGRMRGVESRAARWRMIWATGPDHYHEMMDALRAMGIDPAEHSLNPFIVDMPRALAAADLVVARAGALTLAELTAVARPAVLIPLPGAGAHQTLNAQRLVGAGAAEMLDEDDPHAAQRLETLLGDWSDDPARLEAIARSARRLGRPQAAEDLARMVLKEMNLSP